MKNKLDLPDEVRNAIADHIRQSVASFQREYHDVSHAEDSLTVKLGKALMTSRSRAVSVQSSHRPGIWHWKIEYNKFSDRGKNAEETIIGADGVIEVAARRQEVGSKTALFQCKIEGHSTKNLVEQVAKLSNWREASFVLIFSDKMSSVVQLDEVLRSQGNLSKAKRIPLDDFLIDYFIGCLVGDSDLEYYADRKVLAWRTSSMKSVFASFIAKQRLRFYVNPPAHRYRRSPWGEEISVQSVHDHRMDSAYEGETKRSLRRLVKVYHPDRFLREGTDTITIFQKRLQEINSAISRASASESKAEESDWTRSYEVEQSIDLNPVESMDKESVVRSND
jgi:hypothetical protein